MSNNVQNAVNDVFVSKDVMEMFELIGRFNIFRHAIAINETEACINKELDKKDFRSQFDLERALGRFRCRNTMVEEYSNLRTAYDALWSAGIDIEEACDGILFDLDEGIRSAILAADDDRRAVILKNLFEVSVRYLLENFAYGENQEDEYFNKRFFGNLVPQDNELYKWLNSFGYKNVAVLADTLEGFNMLELHVDSTVDTTMWAKDKLQGVVATRLEAV